MKRGLRYILGVVALLALAVSCAESDVFDNGLAEQSSDDSVQFSMVADYDSYFGTRATLVTNDEQAGTIGVFGYYLESGSWADVDARGTADYFDNTIVSYASGAWSYDNARYWPVMDGASISFFAYSPHSSAASGITATSAEGEAPTITYAIPSDTDDQVDLMVAAVLDASSPNDEGFLQLPMQHMLSTITVVADDYDDIESVVISGTAYSSGTITFDDEGTPEWSAQVSDRNFSHSFQLLDDQSVALLMMIPMEVEEDNLTVDINYNYNKAYEYTHTLSIPAITWEAGVSYTYNYSVLDNSLDIDLSEIDGLDSDEVIRRIQVAMAYGEDIDITLSGAYTDDGDLSNAMLNAFVSIIADYCNEKNEDFTLDMTYLEGFTSVLGTASSTAATFYGNDNLVGIILPEDLTSIGTYGFYGCSSLEYVIFPEGISEDYSDIGTSTFQGCTSLVAIYFPPSVVSVKSGVFDGCTSLQVVSIPGVTEFSGTKIFLSCSSLETLFLSTNATLEYVNYAALKTNNTAETYTNTFSCDLYISSTNADADLTAREGENVGATETNFSYSGRNVSLSFYTTNSSGTYTGTITFDSIISTGSSGVRYAYEESDYDDPDPADKYGDPKDPWMVTGYYNTSGVLVSFISNNSVSY